MINPLSVATRGYLDSSTLAIGVRGYLIVVVDGIVDTDPIILDLFLTTDKKVYFDMALGDTIIETPLNNSEAMTFDVSSDDCLLSFLVSQEVSQVFEFDTTGITVLVGLTDSETIETTLTDIGQTVNIDIDEGPIVLDIT